MAVESPLLETKVNGATDVIINISGDITLTDASDASEYVRQLAGDDVNVIFGAMYDESKTDTCTVTVIATGIESVSGGNAAVAQANAAAKQAAPAPSPAPTPTPVVAAQPVVTPITPVQPVVTPITPVQPTISTIGTPAAEAPATSSATRPLTLNRPSEIKSTVEPKSLKIPDFLQRK
jgi:cell division protein FtsZ